MAQVDSIQDFVPVPGFPGYRINSDGQLQSCLKRGGRVFALTGQWRDVAGWLDNIGYRRVGLRLEGQKRTIYKRIHELVLLSFVGPPPVKHEGCHNDGNRTNNRIANLRWDTRSGNLKDRLVHGTHDRGSNSSSSKMTEAIVVSARQRVANGEDRQKIADEIGVAYSTLVNAVNGSKWRHIASAAT